MIEYEIWHDEYKGDDSVNEYWHGLFFVPVKSKDIILKNLKAIRDEHETSYDYDVKFSGSLQVKKKSRLITNQLQAFVHSLIVKEKDAHTQFFNRSGEKIYKKDFIPFLEMHGVLNCKFVLLKILDNHKGMEGHLRSYADRVETTFRFAFKSGLHYLFENPLIITGFYFDGHEHHGRRIDINRITKGDFAEHVHFARNVFVDDRQKRDRDQDTGIIISLVDNVVGGLSAKIKQVADRNDALYPLEGIIRRAADGSLNLNRQGRWYKSISLSQMELIDEKVCFTNIFSKEKSNQACLF